MEFVVDLAKIKAGLSTVSPAIPDGGIIPTFKFVLMEVHDGRLYFTGQRGDLGIKTSVEAAVGKDGQCLLNNRVLTDLLATFSVADGDTVAFEGQSNNLTVVMKHGRSRSMVHGLNPTDFPPLPKLDHDAVVTLNGPLLVQMYRKVEMAAASANGFQAILKCIQIQFSPNLLMMAAADGFRMSICEHEIEWVDDTMEVLIGAAALGRTLRSLDTKKELKLCLLDKYSMIVLSDGTTDAYLTKVEGKFPNCKTLLPTDIKTKATLDVNNLRRSVKLAATMARKTGHGILLGGGEGTLTISSKDPEYGEQKSTTPMPLEGDDFVTRIDSRYLLNLLDVISEDEVVVEFKSSLSPLLFTGEGDDRFKHVLMPMSMTVDSRADEAQ